MADDDDTRYYGVSTAVKHALDLHIDIDDESEDEDDANPDYVCPFCLEDFDIVGFCCHMDNAHPIEAKSGICPVCAKKVGSNMVAHIITQHGSILKALYKRKLRNSGAYSMLSLLRKPSEEEHLDPFIEESRVVSSSDPLLSSLIYNPPSADEPEVQQPSCFTTEANMAEKSSDKNIRNIYPSPLSDKDQEEKARRCEFVRGLLFSTFLEDDL